MSKKILKRSLALGALMAFVITGSAMAAVVLDGDKKITSINVYDPHNQSWNQSPEEWSLGGYTLTVENIPENNKTETVNMVYRGNDFAVKARDLNITGNENSALIIKGDYFGLGQQIHKSDMSYNDPGESDNNPTSININVGHFEVGSVNNAITIYPDSKEAKIIANTVKLVSSNGNAIQATGNLDIEASGDISVSGGARIIRVSAESNVNIGAQNIYLNANEDGNSTTNVTSDAAIKVDGGATLTIGDENTQNIYMNAVKDSGDVYGITAEGGASITINGSSAHNVETDSGKARVLNIVNSMITVNDNIDMDVTASAAAIGARVEKNDANKDASVTLNGTTTINANSTGSGNAYGFLGKGGAALSLADTTITATSVGGRVDGIYIENGRVNATGEVNINVEGNGVSDKVGAQGVRLAYSNANFAKDVNVIATATADDAIAHGLNILADTGKVASNAVFNGNVKLEVNSAGNAYGAYVSGNGGKGAEFNGSSVEILSTSEKSNATGIFAAYGSKVVQVSGDTDVKITVTAEKGDAIGIWNTYNSNNDKIAEAVELLGNVEIVADGQNSYAVYNESNSNGECGATVIGSKGKKVVLEGDIVATGGYVTTTFGTADSKFDGKVQTSGDGNTTLSFAKGATWNLTGASTLTNATFGEGSVLKINGSDFVKDTGVYALNGTGTLKVEQGAKLEINGITETTYNVAKGFDSIVDENKKAITDGEYWELPQVNALMQGVAWKTADGLQVEVTAKEASDMAADTGISTSTAGLVQSIIENKDSASTDAEKAAVEFIEKVQANNSTPEAVGNAINNATKMGEAGGNSATAASIVKNVTGVTNDRLSFNCGHSAPHKGGHGVGLFEEGSGADIWVEYVHGKDKVEDMPSTAGASSYEGQYNGIVMGVDFKKVNKFQSGIAFNYGEGDTNSVGNDVRTHSDYDFWGVGYYGSIHNDDSNVIFDINYAQTDSDVTQYNSGSVIEASPETTTWSAGVKLEKLYQNENVQIVPYTGLRYMSIDADDYSTKKGEFYYSMDRQDIWLLPLGVSIKQEVTNDNGWTVSPRVDLSYIWAFGDTNSNMEVKSPFAGVSQLGYDVMDDGSFLGLVGIEAHKGQWGYGVAYSYQKGDHSESKKWYVDVNYSF